MNFELIGASGYDFTALNCKLIAIQYPLAKLTELYLPKKPLARGIPMFKTFALVLVSRLDSNQKPRAPSTAFIYLYNN